MEWIAVHWIEITAAILGIAGVWLTTRQNIWCWPIGLVNVLLSLFVFYDAKLYYDVILQIFYFVLTIYGWYNWVFGKKGNAILPVKRITKTHFIYSLVIVVIAVLLFGYTAQRFTDASFPYWDALTTAGGIIATLWMARKIIENWIAWIFIDVLCTVIYIYKELYAFSVLYFIFAILAVIGYYSWKKDLNITVVS